MNQVQLVGNLTKDPVLRNTQNGIPVCTFTLACQRRFKNAEGKYEADFIDCVAWRETAKFVQKHFIKGNKLGLTGSIQSRSYEAQDGSRRYVTEVIVDNVEFVAPRPESATAQAYAAQSYPDPPPDASDQGYDDDDGDLPF